MDTKALRQKILDLAIRGKLVPQDPNDEPASVLLERIRAEKQQMVKEGKLKAKDIKNDTVIFKGDDNLHYEQFADGTVKCIEDEIPFELPDSWAWCRLKDLFNVCSAKRVLQSEWQKEGVPFYRAREIVKLSNNGFVDNELFISLEHYEILKQSYGVPQVGDLMVTGVGTIGKVYIVKENDIFYYKDASVLCFENRYGTIISEFARIMIESPLLQEQIHSKTYGNTVDTITITTANEYLCALPPLPEQRRIIDKINIVSNVLSAIDNHIDKLSIDISNVKSKILDLAIRGKLVPQDPNDEPASVILERIRAEKEELIKQGKIKRDKKESVIFKGDDNSYYEKIGDEITCIDDELPFEIPDSWCWARLSSLTSQIFAGGDKPVNYSKEKTEFYPIPIYSNGVENDGLYGYTDIPRVSERSLTISARGTIGFACVRTEPFVPIIRLLTIIPIKGIDVEFLKLVFQFFIESGKGSSIPQLTVPEVKPKLIPVPSIEEQRKIAQAINNLFVLIESIKASLS